MNQKLWPIFVHTLEPAILYIILDAVKKGLILELPSLEEILFDEKNQLRIQVAEIMAKLRQPI